MKTKTKISLLKYIVNKIPNYVLSFNCYPDTLLISEQDYMLVKDNKFIQSLKTITQENLKYPIILKK